jgi:hypothetical protein
LSPVAGGRIKAQRRWPGRGSRASADEVSRQQIQGLEKTNDKITLTKDTKNSCRTRRF